MLAISPLYNCGEREGEFGNIPTATPDEYSDESFGGGPMLEDINFDDLFLGFVDGELLPELEVDPDETFADFSFGSEDDQPGGTTMAGEVSGGDDQEKVLLVSERREDEDKGLIQDKKVMSATTSKEDGLAEVSTVNSPMPEADRGRKPSAASQAKGSQGKRKVKVDWTPELHRKFVQAVEQLGVDKAVPSRILELMGIDCLTRHNIASHLQKYRSHRKHLLAREAEAASWRQRQQMYVSSGVAAASASGTKRDLSPWLAPTMGFPPPPPPIQPFRPLHVWGHPTMDHTLIHLWPKHLVPAWSPPPPPPPWVPPPPNPSAWLPHYPRGPNGLTQGMPCFPRPLPTMRFPAPTVPGCIPPHPLYRPDSAVSPKSKQLGSPLFDAHPSKESIDATIGDVLAKPCSPLPLGLKPPSLESVMMELQKKGISKIPPTS